MDDILLPEANASEVVREGTRDTEAATTST